MTKAGPSSILPALLAIAMLSGCVSSTLDPGVKTAAVAKPASPPTYDPVERQKAIAEIKEKSAKGVSDQPTNINDNGDGETKPLTAAEIKQKTADLNNTGKSKTGKITDAELAAKQREIAEMRKLSKSHYKDSVKKIEN